MSPDGEHEAYTDNTLPGSEQPTSRQNNDAELHALETLAQHLQTSESLRVDPTFAAQLEQRLQQYNRTLRLQQSEEYVQNRSSRLQQQLHRRGKRSLHAYLALTAAVVCALLLSSAGTLFAASRITDPASPLYAVRHWEQEIQKNLSSTPQDRARITLQIVDDQINALSYYVSQGLYKQALAELKEDFTSTTRAIQTLSVDQEHDQFIKDLTRCKTAASHTLRGLLPQLALAEQLTTTVELNDLGETVPRVDRAEIDLPASSQGTATLLISGSHLVQGARLLLNQQVMAVTGTLQANTLVFALTWQGQQPLLNLGILNPDGTAAETTAITIETAQKNTPNENSKAKSNNSSDKNNNAKAKGQNKNKEKSK